MANKRQANRLRFYVTNKMALEIAGCGKDKLAEVVKSNDVERIKIGGMVLINRAQLESLFSPTEKPRWPPHLGTLDINDFITSSEAAEMLGVTTRRITDMAAEFKLLSHDLSNYGGQVVYSKSSTWSEKMAREALDRARVLKNTPKHKSEK